MKKIISLTLAAAMAAGLAGCKINTPATVGSIGEIEIPAGVYLMSQFQVYQTVSGMAAGAKSVKEVLKAQVTPEDAAAGETVSGSDYMGDAVLDDLRIYAAVETKFAESGLTMGEDAAAAIDANVEQQWTNYGETYAKNGIGQESLRKYIAYNMEYNMLFANAYDVGGAKAVSDADCSAWLEENAVAGKMLTLPSYNMQDSSAAVTDEQTAQLAELANQAVELVNGGESMDTVAEDSLKQAFEILGMTYSADQLSSFYTTQLFMPSQLAYYDDGNGGNTVADPVRAVEYGQAAVLQLGGMQVVVQRQKAVELETLDNIKTNYNLLNNMKGEEFKAELLAFGQGLAQNLDVEAMKTYAPSKIKV